jgi:predicted DsbA family dithiol-disulfide isomerase
VLVNNVGAVRLRLGGFLDTSDEAFEWALRMNFFHHLARHVDADTARQQRLMRAYFTEGEPIGDPEVLVRLVAEAGLDADEARAVLASDRYAEEVRADEHTAARLGIRGVPFFVLGRRYGVSGAQTADVMLEALEKAWDETQGAAA